MSELYQIVKCIHDPLADLFLDEIVDFRFLPDHLVDALMKLLLKWLVDAEVEAEPSEGCRSRFGRGDEKIDNQSQKMVVVHHLVWKENIET